MRIEAATKFNIAIQSSLFCQVNGRYIRNLTFVAVQSLTILKRHWCNHYLNSTYLES